MAEERIFIDILPPSGGFGSCGWFYTEGVDEYFCWWNGEKEPITEAICNNCPHDNSMTRQEAIERMAKAMCRKDYQISCDKCIYKNSKNCKTTLENWFVEDAEAALNALLEVEK